MNRIAQRIILGTLIGLFVGGGYWIFHISQQGRNAAATGEVQQFGKGVGGHFSLTDHHGKAFDTRQQGDKYQLIFFGFTFCPDICPGELATMARAIDQLPEALQNKLQPIFITVDPERDTPEALAEYVPEFHSKIIGLTGTRTQIDAIKEQYAVYAAKAPQSRTDAPDLYLINHSAFMYLIDPDGELVTIFKQDTPPDEIAAALTQRLK